MKTWRRLVLCRPTQSGSAGDVEEHQQVDGVISPSGSIFTGENSFMDDAFKEGKLFLHGVQFGKVSSRNPSELITDDCSGGSDGSGGSMSSCSGSSWPHVELVEYKLTARQHHQHVNAG